MSNSDTATLNKQADLAQEYHQLTLEQKIIVQLLSISYDWTGKNNFLKCLNETGLLPEKNLSIGQLKTRTDKLVAAGLLLQESGRGLKCHHLLVEIATRDALEGKGKRFEKMVKVVQTLFPISTRWDNRKNFRSQQQLIREVRIGLYRQDMDYVNSCFSDYNSFRYGEEKVGFNNFFDSIFNNPFDGEWLQTLPAELFQEALTAILINSFSKLLPAEDAFNLLEQVCEENRDNCNDLLRVFLVEQYLLRGYLPEAEKTIATISDNNKENTLLYLGWLKFLQGENDDAIAYFSNALKMLRKGKNKRNSYFNSIGGLVFILALCKDGSSSSLKLAETYTAIKGYESNHWLRHAYRQLETLTQVLQGDVTKKEKITNHQIDSYEEINSLNTLFSSLCLYWMDLDTAKTRLPRLLNPLSQNAIAAGFYWLGIQGVELLAKLNPEGSYGMQAEILREDFQLDSIVDMIRPQSNWELCLNALANLQKGNNTEEKDDSAMRLAWFITYYFNSLQLQPREQKINAKGEWSKGRPISLKKLSGNLSEYDYFTPQDTRICAFIEAYVDGSYYYGKTEYKFADQAMSALIGHPYVFWEDNQNTRVEIVKGEPELIVKKAENGGLSLEFSPPLANDNDVIAIKETLTRVKIIAITSEHRRIAEILGKENKLEIPSMGEQQVLAAINSVSSIVTVHSDIGGAAEGAEEIPALVTPHVQLLPAGNGLKMAIRSRPFADGGPYFRPGSGGETVIAEIQGKRWQTRRNLTEEKQLAEEAIAACSSLTRTEELDGEWVLTEPEDCLELLVELQTLGEQVIIEWPEGEKMRIAHRADLKDFRMSIQRQQDWFAASGELQLDEDLVLDMQQLMQLLEKTPSRFIPLGDGQFLALTQAFRKRLDEMRLFSEQNGNGMRFHPLAAFAIEDVVDEVGQLKADKHWKQHIQRLKEMKNLQPELPSTFQAELRDYQTEGFQWMARLSHWGVGACLADQMGLGKTIQALAVILTRAHAGATLIIAPTSVCLNWVSEAAKFAPTLNIVQFGNNNRQETLDQLQPLDMLVCSYGLLQQEEVAQMLSQVKWQTIVLDEAQAIKNMTTKRSQAAMTLQGEFKLITTGTPIENHLGELWNLFRFINPGLLGSFERFNQNFATPIEKYQDKQARNKLKKLIQPFILRRTKNQVLSELPSRTEILLHVELSREETAFYEALRLEAIAKLNDSDATAGAKHLQVLAEIMRLRRACCNPSLVKPEMAISSSKLQLFGEVLEELLENRHKALIFSQFVDHLQIIRGFLEERSIKYQYLDGSTPMAERKKRVDAFQAGEGDVFLISLKAGGTGLNLTAADYVIHMDPWWNPAVEDQASDRAHRIGQQRPVTIYRLVAKDTIEDKIVDLHHRKRDLADSLLEGADVSGKVSTEALLELIGAV